MRIFVIKKWVEPYILLEEIKKYFMLDEFIFDGSNKSIMKNNFLKAFGNNENNLGLYMKNVNKFYLFSSENTTDIVKILIEKFSFIEGDFSFDEDLDASFNLVDMAKAEAVLVLK